MRIVAKITLILLASCCILAKKTKAINQNKMKSTPSQSEQAGGVIDSETISINAEARVPRKTTLGSSGGDVHLGGKKGRKIRRRQKNPALNTVVIKDQENLRVDPVV